MIDMIYVIRIGNNIYKHAHLCYNIYLHFLPIHPLHALNKHQVFLHDFHNQYYLPVFKFYLNVNNNSSM